MPALLLRFLRDESGHGVAETLLVAGVGMLIIIPTTRDVGSRTWPYSRR